MRSTHDIKPIPELHIKINSGMKLINCLGFGLPSVSSPEPAYIEVAPECTLFCDGLDCMDAITTLQEPTIYNEFRRKCLQRAPEFHINEVIHSYTALFEQL
jgi:hypothetical protein